MLRNIFIEGYNTVTKVCQFVWTLSSHLRFFHSFGNVTTAGEGLPILTYTRHSWPSSCEGSLACHTYCDTGHPFLMVISDDPWHSHPNAERFTVELSLPVLTTWVCRSWDSNTSTSSGGANVFIHCATAAVVTKEAVVCYIETMYTANMSEGVWDSSSYYAIVKCNFFW